MGFKCLILYTTHESTVLYLPQRRKSHECILLRNHLLKLPKPAEYLLLLQNYSQSKSWRSRLLIAYAGDRPQLDNYFPTPSCIVKNSTPCFQVPTMEHRHPRSVRSYPANAFYSCSHDDCPCFPTQESNYMYSNTLIFSMKNSGAMTFLW